jgi:hypothetical protein
VADFALGGGQAHFKNLYRVMPERYRAHEAKEQELREYLGKDQSILSEVVSGERKTLTLAALRQRIEDNQQLDIYDWGACGCFIDEEKGA